MNKHSVQLVSILWGGPRERLGRLRMVWGCTTLMVGKFEHLGMGATHE